MEMSTTEMKAEIHRKVEAISTMGELLEINQSLDLLVSENLSAEERNVLKRLSKVISDVEKGGGLPHEAVQKEAKRWLHKP